MKLSKTISAIASAFALAFSLGTSSASAGGHGATKDIVDTAVAAETFTTLVAAVQAAGLVDALKSEGKFTVFAPTDEAFAALPAGTVENLLKPENKDQLVAVLTYHVVEGAVMSHALNAKSMHVTTLQGSPIATTGWSGVRVNNAKVIAADIKATNGVIHVIDKVLLP